MSDLSLDNVIDEVQPAEARVAVCTRADLVTRLRQLEEGLAEAMGADARAERADRVDYAPRAPQIAEDIQDLEDEARAVSRVFVFRSLGGRYGKLLKEHPPTTEQRKTEPRLDHNPDTFPYALMAESFVGFYVDGTIAPADGSVEQMRRLQERLSQGQWARLYGEVLAVNVGELTVPFSSRASAVLRRSEPS
jgi:hypothetical protein